MSEKSLSSKLQDDLFRRIFHTHALSLSLAATVILAGVIFTTAAPLAMAHVISGIAAANSEPALYIGAFITLKLLGKALTDVRWRVVNPLLYAATYQYCRTIVQRINATYKSNNGFAESASQVSERTAILSKMQTGSMALLHGLLVVILPAAMEIAIVLAIIYFFIGPIFITYFIIAAVMLYIATHIGRAREIQLGRSSYHSDNDVLMHCGEILAHSKLSREMSAEAHFRVQLDGFIQTSLEQHRLLFAQKYIRATYLSLAVCFAYAVVFAWAGWLIQAQAIMASQVFLLVVYLDRVLAPITGASSAINTIQHGLISIRAGYDLLDDLLRKSAGEPFTQGHERWRRVSLSEVVTFEIQGDTLHLGTGKHIRLVGPSGAGKSTCLRRIYKHLIDSNEIEHSQIHYLSAQVEWIKGSVFDNIALQHPDIGADEVRRALDQWRYGFGNRALGLEQVMEDLSAGERQWVAIVRSLLRKPRVLFLDEATNSLDVRTEPRVWKYLLANIGPQTTLFIVAHRGESPIAVDHEELIEGTHPNLTL
jgi:ATP-binding cassette subfamily C protein